MTQQPRDFNRFAVVPIYADSTGCEAVPQNAILVGSQNAVMERILGSKARKTALSFINDAEHAKGTLKNIREREQAVTAREAAVQEREDAVARAMLADALSKLDATATRLDAVEAKRAADPEADHNQLPLPSPGTGIASGEGEASHADDGHLQSPILPPTAREPDHPTAEDR